MTLMHMYTCTHSSTPMSTRGKDTCTHTCTSHPPSYAGANPPSLGHTLPYCGTHTHTGTHPNTQGHTLTHWDTPSHTGTHPLALGHTPPHRDTPTTLGHSLKTCSFCSQVSFDWSNRTDSTPYQLRLLSISSYPQLVLLGKGLQGVEWGEEHTTRRVAHHQSSAGTGYTPTHNKHTHTWWGTVVCGSGGWTTHMCTSHLFCTHQFKIQ